MVGSFPGRTPSQTQTQIKVYFCDPKSPWQRGTNENTNGLLRQYFPKGTNMRLLTQTDLDKAAQSLNRRPRQTLDGMSPSEKLAEEIGTSIGPVRRSFWRNGSRDCQGNCWHPDTVGASEPSRTAPSSLG